MYTHCEGENERKTGCYGKEYSLLIDGAIELESHIDQKIFFDGLFDAVIEYVEQHNGLAGLAMSYKEYEYTEAHL